MNAPNFTVLGGGPTVVLLHGIGGGHLMFAPQVETLASSGAARCAMNSRCQSPSGLPKAGEVPHSTSLLTSSGRRATTSCATMPPMLCPSRVTSPQSRLSIRAMQLWARPLNV